MPTLDLEKWGLVSGVVEGGHQPKPLLPDMEQIRRRQRPADELAIEQAVLMTQKAIEGFRSVIFHSALSQVTLPGQYQPLYLYTYADLVRMFEGLRSEWKSATSMLSSTHEISMHSAYQKIVGLGRQAIPLLLRELQAEPDQWFWALEAISRENPADDDDDFDSRAQKWVNWGRERGYLTSA